MQSKLFEYLTELKTPTQRQEISNMKSSTYSLICSPVPIIRQLMRKSSSLSQGREWLSSGETLKLERRGKIVESVKLTVKTRNYCKSSLFILHHNISTANYWSFKICNVSIVLGCTN